MYCVLRVLKSSKALSSLSLSSPFVGVYLRSFSSHFFIVNIVFMVMILLCHQVKSVDVAYDLKCEDAPSHYGHGYGKDQSKVTHLTFIIISIPDCSSKLFYCSVLKKIDV